MTPYKVEIYQARRGVLKRRQYRARVVSTANGKTLFVSAEGYNNSADLREISAKVFPHLQCEGGV